MAGTARALSFDGDSERPRLYLVSQETVGLTGYTQEQIKDLMPFLQRMAATSIEALVRGERIKALITPLGLSHEEVLAHEDNPNKGYN